MKSVEPTAKMGATHLDAMFRVGLKELSQILPAFPDSVKPVEDPGLVGNKLPMEVYQDRHGRDVEQDRSHEHELELQQ